MSSPPPALVSKSREIPVRSMPPATRSQAHPQCHRAPGSEIGYDDSSSYPESDSGSSLDDETDQDNVDPSVVTSPSNLRYNIDGLSPEARRWVRNAFNEPPQLALQYCLARDNVYAFEMTEIVPRSIRIGSPDSPYAVPECSCTGSRSGPPCKHLLWLHDQLAKQTLYTHDAMLPLTMTPDGFPKEIGNPFADISAFHLNILADGLHSYVKKPDLEEDSEDSGTESDSDSTSDEERGTSTIPNLYRVQEIREMLSAVASPPYASPPLEEFRPDIFSNPTAAAAGSERRPIKHQDLEATIFRMLLNNHEFFHYFLSKMRPNDLVNDTFYKLSQRVDHVLRELDAYASSPATPSSLTPSSISETPRNVAWAARHITGVVSLIRAAIFRRDRPLEQRERISAARALVGILASVVERNRDFTPPGSAAGSGAAAAAASRWERNLYLRLVGDRDNDFVLGVLSLLPPDAVSQFLPGLEIIQDQLGVHGAPASYVEKLRVLMTRLRRASGASSSWSSGSTAVAVGAGAGSKRHSQGPDRGSKRMK